MLVLSAPTVRAARVTATGRWRLAERSPAKRAAPARTPVEMSAGRSSFVHAKGTNEGTEPEACVRVS
jgi:hypothetical protein